MCQLKEQLFSLNYFVNTDNKTKINVNSGRMLKRRNDDLEKLVFERTDYLNPDVKIAERMYHILHDMTAYKICSAPFCDNQVTKWLHSYSNCCSRKCNVEYEKSTIDDTTGKTLWELKFENNKKSNQKVGNDGLTSYQRGAIKAAHVRKTTIDPKTSKTIQQTLNERSVRTKAITIDPETGLTIEKLALTKRVQTMSEEDETGNRIYDTANAKRQKTHSTIDPETGLTPREKASHTARSTAAIRDFNVRFKRMSNKTLPLFTIDTIATFDSNKLPFECKNCGSTFYDTFRGGHLYTRHYECYPKGNSMPQKEITHFVNGLIETPIIENTRSVIKPYELDFYIPNEKLAIEFDGLYWHSHNQLETSDQRSYHLTKTEMCSTEDIQLIHIFEDEWNNKKEIVKSRLSGLLGKNTRIYARHCQVREIDAQTKNNFLNNNHIQGADTSKVKIGLFHENNLVACMTFGRARFNKNYEYELIRYCSEKYTNIVGGAGKLLKYFERNYSPSSIISYADRRWSTGNLYNSIGFDFLHTSSPNYFYIANGSDIRETRNKYQKHKLPLLLKNFDINKTESENMFDNGYRRIWDCGNLVYGITYK